MLTEMRDTVGLLLLGDGIDPSTVRTFKEAAPAFDKLEQAKNDGRSVPSPATTTSTTCRPGTSRLRRWSGDVLQLQKDNPDCGS